MAKSELFWFPIGPLIKAGGGFKVRRGQADAEAMGTAVELAKEGYVVAMFPEGTRRKKGAFKTREAGAHTGAARIAHEAGVPLIPAGIKGPGALSRLEAWRVKYGEAIPVTDDLTETTARLMEAIRKLEASL
jgi:1-acyl-sn-glycerol-3-phosphate acyltransferase